jgi:hypothetical protein
LPDCEQNFLRLGTWSLDQLPAEMSFVITRGDYPLEFDEVRVDCASPALTARIEQVTNASWRATLIMKSTGLLGGNGIPITFRFLSHGKILPETVVKEAFMETVGPIAASPSSILLAVSPGEHINKTIAITRRAYGLGESPPIVTSIEHASTHLTPTWRKEANTGNVIMEYTAPLRAGTDRGEIIISVLDQGIIYRIKISYLALIS